MSHDLRFLCSLLDYTLKTPDRNFTLVPLAASADYLYEVAYRKIPNISPGLIEVGKHFSGGFFISLLYFVKLCQDDSCIADS